MCLKSLTVFFISTCCILFTSYRSLADDFTGNKLLTECEQLNRAEGFHCLGYIHGIISGSEINNIYRDEINSEENNEVFYKLVGFCLPSGVTSGQIKDIIVKELKNNPESRHQLASVLVLDILHRAYPCS